ncbi:hypothetical protein JCGZ_07981 [Jatropha curcas]|uniref:DUF4283 domain-containing protein n=1 Tax=Jatropha curcas TaxID=180498 RepID=A0A067LQT5_JATCU|nr:hypothetical protein JCGZ_07981 [Jatropha curcas]
MDDDEMPILQSLTLVISMESDFCMVGRFLTGRNINFPAMRNTMATLRRPGRVICIEDLGRIFFVQFSVSWTFDELETEDYGSSTTICCYSIHFKRVRILP